MSSDANPGGVPQEAAPLSPEQNEFTQGFQAGFERGFKLARDEAAKQDTPRQEPGDDQQAQKNKEPKGDGQSGGNEKPGEKQSADKKPVYKRPIFIIIAAIVVILLLVGVIIAWLILRQFVSTDDAYIDGHVTEVSPRASGQVLFLHVRDNELVHQGDLLVELDPTDYQVALNQAEAQVVSSQGRLAQAKAQLETAKAEVVQAQAGVDAAQVQLDNATRDAKRYEEVDARARSRQQLDNVQTTQKNAQAELEQAQARKTSADAGVVSGQAAIAAAEGELQTAKANQRRAEVNLSYCKIYAPTDGRVTERTVEVGNYLAIGQAMFILADPHVWVTANYKETQLSHMRLGQRVTIRVDAFPGLKWHGHVDSFQAGSGSRFSVLPAENATGNFVKVVQRIPVKILFDDAVSTNSDMVPLSAGMSVVPHVFIR